MAATRQDQPNHEAMTEAYEKARIDALTPLQQAVVTAHHVDQFQAVSSFVESNLLAFVEECNALGIASWPTFE